MSIKLRTIYSALFLAIFFIASASAADKDNYPIQYQFASNSKMTAERINSKIVYMVNFSGEIEFTGNYVIKYEERRKTKLILSINPTASFSKHLTIKDRGKSVEVDKLFVGEKPELIKLLIGIKNYQSMMSGNIKTMSGQAVFLIDSFSATYECDKLMYYAGVKTLIKVNGIAETGSSESIYSC